MYHLRRVYPDGLRVTSSNLDPWVRWRSGTQMACLNWQSWNEAMWLNEAMFVGTGGWVVRPNSELEGGDEGRQWNFMGRVVGMSARESSCMRAASLVLTPPFPFVRFSMQYLDPRGTNMTL